MVVHTFNPSTQESEFKARLSYIARPYFKKKMKMHSITVKHWPRVICSPNPREKALNRRKNTGSAKAWL
jgi:hypothetical protein